MEAKLYEITQRVEKLEQAVDALRRESRQSQAPLFANIRPLTLAEQGRLMTERARRNAAHESFLLSKIFDEMGIPTDPTMTREKVQQMYLEAGFDPEANDFAQGIVAMRDE